MTNTPIRFDTREWSRDLTVLGVGLCLFGCFNLGAAVLLTGVLMGLLA